MCVCVLVAQKGWIAFCATACRQVKCGDDPGDAHHGMCGELCSVLTRSIIAVG